MVEQTARQICALDLEAKGFSRDLIPDLTDRFWPVVANEIRRGVTIIGEWPFRIEEIESLAAEFQALRPPE